jgi:carbonic anhydrase/acetyltransferase-like protein (isoleucine patch superfamily)
MENWSTVLLDQERGDAVVSRRPGHLTVAPNTVIRADQQCWVVVQTVVNIQENLTIILLERARESKAKEFNVVFDRARE